MPRIKDTGYALWPTVTATVHGKTRYRQGGKPLTMVFAEKFGTAALSPEFAEWMMGYEQQFTKLIPTPIASDCYGGNPNRMKNHSQTVQVERERDGSAGSTGD
jgi:hypothetical protein